MTGPQRKWTSDQQTAILEPPGRDILVSAAAGSGKTTVLVGRVLHLLTNPQAPVDIRRILVVTFTEAAAANMRDRLRRELHERAAIDPTNEYLKKQAFFLESAQISTIHSFCMRLLTEHHSRLALDPSFTVLDPLDSELLKREVLDEVFQEFYKDSGPAGRDFAALLRAYGQPTGDEALRTILLRASGFLEAFVDPDSWLREAAAVYEMDGPALIAESRFGENIRGALDRIKASFQRALDAAEKAGIEPYLKYLPPLLSQMRTWRTESERGVNTSLYEQLRDYSFPRIPSVSNDVPGKERTKSLIDKAKELFTHTIAEGLCAASPAEITAALEQVRPHARILAEVLQRFRDRFREAKTERATLDFGDLERFACELLGEPGTDPDRPVPSEIARALQKHYEHILIDEYQDTSRLQEAILRLVSREAPGRPGNRFMVGDLKQCIYGFRQADPELFREKLGGFSAGKTSQTLRVDLRENFRSSANLIKALNKIFEPILTPGVGGVDYDDLARLRYGATYPGSKSTAEPAVEVHLISRSLGTPEEENETQSDVGSMVMEDLEVAEREAIWIGKRIQSLVGRRENSSEPEMTVYDEDGRQRRPVTFRDIVVLLRATAVRAEQVARKLGEMGIPVVADTKTGLFESRAVTDLLCLLETLDSPRRDIPLAAILRSPFFFAFNETELFEIRQTEKNVCFWEALRTAASRASSPGLRQKCWDTVERIEHWRDRTQTLPPSELLEEIFQETGALNRLEGLAEGPTEAANVQHLMRIMGDFEERSGAGLAGLVRFLQQLSETGADEGAAQPLGPGEDVVRVMSIHKSKGLEFPVVFVAALDKQFNLGDLSGDVLLDRERGLGLYAVEAERFSKYPTLPHTLTAAGVRQRALSEEMRILYVALTRARERLILSATVDVAAEVPGWKVRAEGEGPIAHHDLVSAKSAMEWLGPALLRTPDGTCLSEMAAGDLEGDQPIGRTASLFNVIVHPAGEVRAWEPFGRKTRERKSKLFNLLASGKPIPDAKPDSEVEDAIQRLTWQYPYESATRLTARRTPTEYSRTRADADREEEQTLFSPPFTPRPAWMAEQVESPLSRGSAMHHFLEVMDLATPPEPDAIRRALDKSVEQGELSEVEARLIDIPGIARFLESPLGVRLGKNPERIRREAAFTLRVPAREVDPSIPEEAAGEPLFFRGSIDCLLLEEDGALFVDYKTDRVKPGEEPVRAEHYKGQMAIYRRALEASLEKPVKEAYLFFTETGIAAPV